MSKTITEALAEIKTIEKRLAKLREFVLTYIVRNDTLKDPLEKDGGSRAVLEAKRQAISDLESRVVALRSAINKSNQETVLVLGKTKRTVSEWLIWRREVMPTYRKFLASMTNSVTNTRNEHTNMRSYSKDSQGDIVVNVDEKQLGQENESLEEVLGNLDGQLSLLNATTLIEV